MVNILLLLIAEILLVQGHEESGAGKPYAGDLDEAVG